VCNIFKEILNGYYYYFEGKYLQNMLEHCLISKDTACGGIHKNVFCISFQLNILAYLHTGYESEYGSESETLKKYRKLNVSKITTKAVATKKVEHKHITTFYFNKMITKGCIQT
jgi:hypothetical protein